MRTGDDDEICHSSNYDCAVDRIRPRPGYGVTRRKKHQEDTQKSEDKAKKKVDEKAYQDALKSIPNSLEKLDPWKSMR